MLIQLHGNLIATLQTYVFQNLKVLIGNGPTENIRSNVMLAGEKQNGIVKQGGPRIKAN